MAGMKIAKFDVVSFLESAGLADRKVLVKAKHAFFIQGTPADCIFFLQAGRVKLTATSRTGREATVALLSPGEFIGEEAVAGVPGLRMTTATAIMASSALAIDKKEMLLALHQEHALNDLFLGLLVARSMRSQADLIDQLFNSSEKRLARILWLMAELGKPEATIPKVTQETLAEMVGTTRSRVNFFMNRFRKLGFIDYNGEIRVHQSLLNVILHD
jgi:CRP/FNR family transcriptional regulator, cyclic AMP receptor protein